MFGESINKLIADVSQPNPKYILYVNLGLMIDFDIVAFLKIFSNVMYLREIERVSRMLDSADTLHI